MQLKLINLPEFHSVRVSGDSMSLLVNSYKPYATVFTSKFLKLSRGEILARLLRSIDVFSMLGPVRLTFFTTESPSVANRRPTK